MYFFWLCISNINVIVGCILCYLTDDGFGKHSLDTTTAVYLREKFNSEIQARREHFTKQNKILRELERGNTEVDVRALSPSRRMKAALQFSRNRSANALRGPQLVKGGGGLRKNSVFFRSNTMSKRDPLEDLLPPQRYRTYNVDDKHRWRDLSDIQRSSWGSIAEEIGWHDSMTLLLRLRRFSDLREFMDQMSGQVNRRTGACNGSGVLMKGGLDTSSHIKGGNDGTFRQRGSGTCTCVFLFGRITLTDHVITNRVVGSTFRFRVRHARAFSLFGYQDEAHGISRGSIQTSSSEENGFTYL